jgi:hypothetical protein
VTDAAGSPRFFHIETRRTPQSPYAGTALKQKRSRLAVFHEGSMRKESAAALQRPFVLLTAPLRLSSLRVSLDMALQEFLWRLASAIALNAAGAATTCPRGNSARHLLQRFSPSFAFIVIVPKEKKWEVWNKGNPPGRKKRQDGEGDLAASTARKGDAAANHASNRLANQPRARFVTVTFGTERCGAPGRFGPSAPWHGTGLVDLTLCASVC